MKELVLVAGAGPVGLTMALELARYGVPVRIIDKIPEAAHTSRAVAVWPRTLELLDRSGAAADILAMGNKVTIANILSGGRPVASLSLEHVPSPYPFALMVPQYDTEAVLRRHLAAHGVTPELGVELLGFEQDEDGLSAHLREPDGTERTEPYAYLVACDGAHSVVRHQLGLDFQGDTLGLDWTQGDFHLSGYPFPSSQMAIFWHEDGPLLFFPMAPDRARIITSLGPSTETPPVALDQQAFQTMIDARGPGGITLTGTEWVSAFRINERQVENYRSGRVFLAGDAAHVHSPAGGQGMNTGMQDAINLAWKLALVIRGLASAPALLDSYDLERRPVGALVIAASGRMTRIGTLADHTLQHVRDFVAHVLMGLSPVQRTITGLMAEVSIGYPDSPLNGPFQGEAKAGARVEPVAGDTPFGAGDAPLFTACGGSGAAELAARFPRLVAAASRPSDGGAFLSLVRPDGYLAAQVEDADWQELVPYLRRIGAER
ncbi:FAD-dependent monooxygenase [Chelatococcus asaccharovorans]|uniref:FAD-dependent monooxygenase n=1 Tax=Chelatococcus asaccharovorans TaxID=28210 RepID=UPI00224C7655|nr:FAD-dependent monooxygenase [Chelatococcus asaccharovorans]CAH1674027.1 2-polyprenyl-6-methoxyphenol hydroxylase-like FAD-dependent oxidoreductase [Chelatococcus asaccharovorans]CAH1674582.1 2-polyprenyl-6-methoxyphenol hydroxylase-like FAD-dependent oxidoreductase [Chelatococcus asaccharovorans]